MVHIENDERYEMKTRKLNKKAQRTVSRAQEMLTRDAKSGFGAKYIPAIQVNRSEAPSQSSPSLLLSAELGRHLHLLSIGELATGLHALYVGLEPHEQRLLKLFEAEHPLARHPAMVGKILPTVPGTVAICEEMGIRHPIARDDSAKDGHQPQHSYFPYVGDLLVIKEDSEDCIRCVNLSVKRSKAQFGGSEFDKFFSDIEEVKLDDNSYAVVMKGSTKEPHGAITPGKRLGRLLDQYSEFTFRVMFH